MIPKEKRRFRPLVEEICAVVPGEVRRPASRGGRGEGESTVRPALEMLMKHPLTGIGLKKFLDDGNKSGATI